MSTNTKKGAPCNFDGFSLKCFQRQIIKISFQRMMLWWKCDIRANTPFPKTTLVEMSKNIMNFTVSTESERTERIWKNLKESDRIWKNLIESERIWKNLKESERIWKNQKEPERTWKNLKELKRNPKNMQKSYKYLWINQNLQGFLEIFKKLRGSKKEIRQSIQIFNQRISKTVQESKNTPPRAIKQCTHVNDIVALVICLWRVLNVKRRHCESWDVFFMRNFCGPCLFRIISIA